MWVTQHVIVGIVPSILWGYLSGNWLFAVFFMAANVLCDGDHFIGVMLFDRTTDISLIWKNLKTMYFSGLKRYEENLACVFHTVEFMTILGVLGFYFSFFIPIFFGVLFHVLCDIATVAWKKNKRIFFLSFFILKYLRGGFNERK